MYCCSPYHVKPEETVIQQHPSLFVMGGKVTVRISACVLVEVSSFISGLHIRFLFLSEVPLQKLLSKNIIHYFYVFCQHILFLSNQDM